jgi:hypothetical protein
LNPLRKAARRVPPIRHLCDVRNALIARREKRLIITEYSYDPHRRPIEGTAGGMRLAARLRAEEDRYAATLRGIAQHVGALLRIPRAEEDFRRPFWVNNWFPPFDGAALYGLIAELSPSRYIEVGSVRVYPPVSRAR